MAQLPPARQGMKTFFVIWMGQLVSMLGSGLTNFALGVWIFEQTGQATPFAMTILFANLPRIALAPLAGAFVDRWNRRWVMILADSGNMLVTLTAAVLLFNGRLEVGHIYLIAFFSSICATFQEPAYSASITLLVPKKDLARSSGMVQMGQAIEMIATPLLAGVLFVVVGLRGIILIDFVTYLVALGALMLIRIPDAPTAVHEADRPNTIWRDALYGWHYLRARTGLFGLLIFFALVNFLMNFAAVLTVPLVLSFGSAGTLGVVQMMTGVGMLLGSVAMSVWGGPQRRITAVLTFITLSSFGLMIAGLQPSVFFVGGGLFLMMVLIPLASAPSQAIFQAKVEPAVQGRVFAIRGMISRSMMPLAFLSAGTLADHLFEPLLLADGRLAPTLIGQIIGVGPGRGIGFMFVMAGFALLVAGLAAFANPRIRHVEDELPDVVSDRVEEGPLPVREAELTPA